MAQSVPGAEFVSTCCSNCSCWSNERSAKFAPWSVWLESAGLPDLRAAGALRFSHYDQVIRAALDNQGVALGRRPLVASFLADGTLVTPFATDSVTDRAYFIVRASATRARSDVDDFVAWLIDESAALVRQMVRNKARAHPNKK